MQLQRSKYAFLFGFPLTSWSLFFSYMYIPKQTISCYMYGTGRYLQTSFFVALYKHFTLSEHTTQVKSTASSCTDRFQCYAPNFRPPRPTPTPTPTRTTLSTSRHVKLTLVPLSSSPPLCTTSLTRASASIERFAIFLPLPFSFMLDLGFVCVLGSDGDAGRDGDGTEEEGEGGEDKKVGKTSDTRGSMPCR